MMELFYSPASPFVRKVMVLLHETGQIDEVRLIPATVSPLTTGDAALTHNPLGKIPALKRDDGPSIYDSRVICRYLDDHAGGTVYPASRLWETLTLEATADGIMDAAVLMIYEARVRPEDNRSPEWVEAQWSKIVRSLDAVNGRWISHLNGRLDMGQIGIGCALGYLDFRHSDRNWRTGRDALATWYGKFAARPSMTATAPPAA